MNSHQEGIQTNLGIFLSGKGSNAEAIIQYFSDHPRIRVKALYTNREDSGAFELSEKYGLPVLLISREALLYERGSLIVHLKQHHIDVIVLAGFLRLIPAWLIHEFPDRIVNIHPALLPNYGGKGMYGQKVHEAVWQNKEPKSGITIHLVNERYDEGAVIEKVECDIDPADTPADIERKVRFLELKYYPPIIERYVEEQFGESPA